MSEWIDTRKVAQGPCGDTAWNPAAIARHILAQEPLALCHKVRVGSGLYADPIVRTIDGRRERLHIIF